MKRYLSTGAVAASLLITSAAPAFAARPEVRFPVTFNGHPVAFDVQPTIVNGRSFVPFRAIFEKMGATVSFDAGTQTISAERDGKKVSMKIGSTSATVDGRSTTLTDAPFIQDGRSLVPLRFVGEAFGATVDFDAATTKISIVDPNWPKRGGTLVVGQWSAPRGNLNPYVVSDAYGSDLVDRLYDGLWTYDERFTPVPALAEAWEWTENDTKLTFYLRKDATFADGKPITAKDYVFGKKAVFHPNYIGPGNSGFEDLLGWEEYTNGVKGETAANFASGIVTDSNIEGLYAQDDYTLVYKLKQPNAKFIYDAQAVPLDRSKYGSVPVQDWGTSKDPNNLYPNGTGAFTMGDYRQGQYAILNANPRYWAGRPYVDKVMFRVLPSAVAVGEVNAGKLDLSEFTAAEFDAYKQISSVKIHEFADAVYQHMTFNVKDAILSDKNVRKAISYAIDRDSIISGLLGNHGQAMYAPVHPLSWAWTDDVEKYDYSPKKAGELLDAAGWKMGSDGFRYKNGQKLTIKLSHPNEGNAVRVKTAPVVQQMLIAVGIDLQLVPYDFGTLATKVFDEQDFQMYFLGWQLGNTDPDQIGLWDKSATVLGANNAGGWWTERSEQLLKAGLVTADIEERIEIYTEWQQLWVDEAPSYLFYMTNGLWAQNTRVGNFKPGPQGSYWNIEEIYLKN